MIQFEHSFDPITEQDVVDFETYIDRSLPAEYRDFLVRHNGGKPVKRRFKTVDDRYTTSIMLFFPISTEAEQNLKTIYEHYVLSKKIPHNLLPIGIDPFESLICLNVTGDSSIYFCDMDDIEETGTIQSGDITLVAENFTLFLNALKASDSM